MVYWTKLSFLCFYLQIYSHFGPCAFCLAEKQNTLHVLYYLASFNQLSKFSDIMWGLEKWIWSLPFIYVRMYHLEKLRYSYSKNGFRVLIWFRLNFWFQACIFRCFSASSEKCNLLNQFGTYYENQRKGTFVLYYEARSGELFGFRIVGGSIIRKLQLLTFLPTFLIKAETMRILWLKTTSRSIFRSQQQPS